MDYIDTVSNSVLEEGGGGFRVIRDNANHSTAIDIRFDILDSNYIIFYWDQKEAGAYVYHRNKV